MAKQYPKHFKEQVLQEVKEIGSVPTVAKRHEVNENTVYRWLQKEKHRDWEMTPMESKQTHEYIPSAKEYKDLEKENNQLKKLLGEKDLQISVLQDMVKKTKSLRMKG